MCVCVCECVCVCVCVSMMHPTDARVISSKATEFEPEEGRVPIEQRQRLGSKRDLLDSRQSDSILLIPNGEPPLMSICSTIQQITIHLS